MVVVVVLCEGCLAVLEAGGVWFREVWQNRGARLHLLVLSLIWVSFFYFTLQLYLFIGICENTML